MGLTENIWKSRMDTDKKIKKNYIYNVTYQILNLIAPLLTTPYVARVLGVEQIGRYSYISSITTYFITLAILGSTPYAQREIAYLKGDKEKYSQLFWEMVAFRTLTVLVSCLLYGIIIIGAPTEERMLYILQGINIIIVAVDITWFFQGLENFKKVIIRNMIVRCASIVLIFLLVKNESDLAIYMFILSGIPLIGQAMIWGYLKEYLVPIPYKKINVKCHFKGIMDLFIPTIATAIYRAFDKTMIGLFTDSSIENGYYEQADRIVQMCITVPTALSTVMSPRMAASMAKKDTTMVNAYMYKTYEALLLMAMPLGIGIFCVSDMIVPWFLGEQYYKVILLLKIFSLIVPIVTLSNAVGVQYLIQAREEKVYTKSIFLGAGVNFGINLLMIPRMASVGAAIASVIAEFSILFYQMLYICKKDRTLKLKQLFNNLWTCIISCMCMALIVVLVKPFFQPNFLGTICVAVIGACTYGAMLLIFKEPMVCSVLDAIMGKLSRK